MEREMFYSPLNEKAPECLPKFSKTKSRAALQEEFDKELINMLEEQIEGMKNEPIILSQVLEGEIVLADRDGDFERAKLSM